MATDRATAVFSKITHALHTSFRALAAPGWLPARTIFQDIASSTGRARSTSTGSPDTT